MALNKYNYIGYIYISNIYVLDMCIYILYPNIKVIN